MTNVTALAASCLAALMFGLEISSIPVVLPLLGEVLHAGFVAQQWVMNAYTIGCTTVLMAAGTLADRYGEGSWSVWACSALLRWRVDSLATTGHSSWLAVSRASVASLAGNLRAVAVDAVAEGLVAGGTSSVTGSRSAARDVNFARLLAATFGNAAGAMR
jgi:MFS family permease